MTSADLMLKPSGSADLCEFLLHGRLWKPRTKTLDFLWRPAWGAGLLPVHANTQTDMMKPDIKKLLSAETSSSWCVDEPNKCQTCEIMQEAKSV